MAAALLALLAQGAPNIQTRKALLLTGLQHDFLSPDGKLPVSTASGFLERVKDFVPTFRDYGDVVWVRSQFQESREVNSDEAVVDHVIAGSAAQKDKVESNDSSHDDEGSPVPPKKARLSNESTERPLTAEDLIKRIESGHAGLTELQDEDEELFLSETTQREPCCIPGSRGAEYADQIKDLVDPKDIEVVKTYYSAFGSTSLLLTLRSRLITELFICGCITNLSVFATAMDAARYGIKVTLVEDCLGYRRKGRHELAIQQLHDIMEADVKTSAQVIDKLKNPQSSSEEEEEADDGEQYDLDGEIAVGEDAEGISANLLEADSTDEENHYASLVRSSYISALPLPARYASLTAHGLPASAAAGPKSTPSLERTESSGTRDPDAGNSADDGRNSTSPDSVPYGGHGKRENTFERRLDGSAGRESVKDGAVEDESSSRVVSRRPWIDDIIRDDIQDDWKKTTQVTSGRSTHPGLNAISALVGLNQSTVNDMEDMMADARRKNSAQDTRQLRSIPLFGEDKDQESGGSRLSFDLLPPELANTVFDELNNEVIWQKMHHQTGEVPRLVCCQGTIGDDGSMPVYRHPSDQTLPIETWTPAVDKVRKAAEEVAGHPLNHALIQLYRGGTDFISEHSDKTLDIVKGSSIVNVSFGAQRTMRLRTKRTAGASLSSSDTTAPSRTTHRVPMPHNSAITMSLPTNAEYLHGINADKRPSVELNDAEKAFDGQRISLTFRNIGTFLNSDSSRIWGQGAVGKTKDQANAVINANAAESERLVRAFGLENQSSRADWDAWYGGGFDVLHLK